MRCALLLTVGVLVSPALAQEVDASRAITVEVTPERERWYVGERVVAAMDVHVRDREFLDDHVVQPFQRQLDLPVRIVAPWLVGRTVLPAARFSSPVRVAVNDDVWGFLRENDRLSSGFTFVVNEPAEVDLGTELELTVASEFREDFVEGRVAVDPRLVRIAYNGPTIRILPIPEEGRPNDFSGGVGAYEIGARLEPGDPERAGVIRLSVAVLGGAARPAVAMPVLADLDGFHLVGSREGTNQGGDGGWTKTQHYELERIDPDVDAVPPIAFTYFDPVAAEFRTIRTQAIPLPAAQLADPVPAAPAPADDPEDVGHDLVIPSALLLLVVVVVCVLLVRRRGREHDSAGAASERASREARAALDAPGAGPADVLAGYLAQRLGCEPAAVVSRDLARRLREAGFDADRAQCTADLLERLVAARYGGAATTEADCAAVRAILDER